MSTAKLIVGLGNPGKGYENTRHNLGFLVIHRLIEKCSLKLEISSVCKGVAAKGEVEGVPYHLLMPLTYVNNSGAAVKQFIISQEMAPSDILVVCDDFSLPFGQVRLRAKGSDGGHNGLTSIILKLETEEFARLRMGIGSPPQAQDPADFVLEDFKKNEIKQVAGFVDEACDCCLAWLTQDLDQVMSQFNKRKEDG